MAKKTTKKTKKAAKAKPPAIIEGTIEDDEFTGNPNGRPQIEIDWATVDKLLGIQCTAEEVASVIGCSSDTLGRACKREHGITYAQYSAGKRAAGKASLRHKQWTSAMGGNIRMQIHLGKHVLDQVDRREISGPNGKPLEMAQTVDMSKLSTKALEEIAALGGPNGEPLDESDDD